jgi:hypothetical protein
MEKVLTPKERLLLIRKGNEFFNGGDVEKAARIFTATAYKDGLIRVGDYYYFDRKDPLKALQFYLEAQYEKRIREVFERIALVLKKWLSEDENPAQPSKILHASDKENEKRP